MPLFNDWWIDLRSDETFVQYGFQMVTIWRPGVTFINCFAAFADLLRLALNLYARKKLLKSWAFGANCSALGANKFMKLTPETFTNWTLGSGFWMVGFWMVGTTDTKNWYHKCLKIVPTSWKPDLNVPFLNGVRSWPVFESRNVILVLPDLTIWSKFGNLLWKIGTKMLFGLIGNFGYF